MENIRYPRGLKTLHLKTRELHFVTPFAHTHYLTAFHDFTVSGMPSLLSRLLVLLDNSIPISGTECRGRTFVLDEVIRTPKAKNVIGGVPIL
jgi:hypothetical protein